MVTRWCRWPHVMPGQLQKCRDSFQELRIPKGSLVILALKASKESLSVSLLPPSTNKKEEVSRDE